MVNRILAFLLLAFLSASANAQTPNSGDATPGNVDGRDSDRAKIRANIESIFQAFIDWDVDKIYATHSEDWRGFLEGSRVPIKGIDEYMKANGIEWPKRDKESRPTPNPSAGYKIKDLDITFQEPDLAVASFIGEFERRTGGSTITTNRLHIMDVYARRKGAWIQVASHTVVDPAWRAELMSMPANVPPEARQQILNAREAVWRAYFSNDHATLEKLIPAETIAIDAGSDTWSDRAAILAGSKGFAESGGKLVRLEFPKTEIQVYGNTIILYTTYSLEIEVNGKRTERTGRGTEIFVRRNGQFVNVGWHLDKGK
ncbi:MAG: DUF4440 domain-containing protein [Blastocatellia bacterium]